jgi:CubicO group peptidase (beta-lactamase class C family)
MKTMSRKNITLLFVLLFALKSKAQNLEYSWVVLDSVIHNSITAYQIPGMVVGIIENDSLTERAYGMSNVQSSTPTLNSTSFELGSLSKQFTASAILLLQQRGELSVNDYINKYIPNCPENWDDIKIKHLIWHTSGLPGLFVRDNFKSKSFTGYSKMSSSQLDGMMQANFVSKELAFESVKSDKLDFKPGEKHNYSDVGYLLLGLIIDNITGSYRDFMTNDIFIPCGMMDTYILEQERVVLNQSRGYSLKDGKLINIMRTWDYEIPSFFGVFSNVNDLFKWHKVLFSNQLLDEESRAFLFSNGYLSNGQKINYGGGWNIQNIGNEKYVSHGGITGVNFIILPNKEISIITLSNLGYNGNDPVMSLYVATELLDILNLQKRVNNKHITTNGNKVVDMSKRFIADVEGEYETIDGIKASIYIENDKPIFDCPAQGMKHEIALLDNNILLVLDLDFEYTLSYDKGKKLLVSNLYRTFKSKS